MSGQGHSPQSTPVSAALALESLLSFWAEAGVDTVYEDAPVNRVAERPRPPKSGAAAQSAARQPTAPIPSPASTLAPDTAGALAEARRLAAEATTLDALAAAISTFDGCPLKQMGAKQSVFSRGAADAAVMVIGEGPGADEDAQGAPFVGRAGKLLDKMLAAAGLSDRVFITNTVYWRPPGNRAPTPEEQLVCLPFLEKTVALVKPRLLLLVGGASAKSLLQKSEGVLALRGRWFDWRATDGALEVPAMPTLHPAFLLRQPAAKKKAWADLLMLAERLDRPERPEPST